jgi:hypothetical protein
MSNYFTEKTSGNVAANTDVSLLVASGNKTFTDNFVGFPSCVTSNNSWEQPTDLGYEIFNNTNLANVDIAKTVKAAYKDYTAYSSVTIPDWCNKLKIIAISGGGGGGGGGANNNSNRGGAGGSGAGGFLAIMTSKLSKPKDNYTINIDFSGSGAGGAYQGSSGSNGKSGTDGVAITIYTSNNSINIPGGDSGFGGQGTDNSNNISSGGSNNSPDVNITYNGNFATFFTLESTEGNAGGQGNNSAIGAAGTVQNNLASPTLNTNVDYTGSQNNSTSIDNANQRPGIGQGGVGGWNSNNNNGYQGQNGGPALVRVYFLK